MFTDYKLKLSADSLAYKTKDAGKFIADHVNEAKNTCEAALISTRERINYLKWLAGRVSAYGLLSQTPGDLTRSREAERSINQMCEKLLEDGV